MGLRLNMIKIEYAYYKLINQIVGFSTGGVV